MNGLMDGWMDEWTDGWMDKLMDRWMNGLMDGWMDELMNRWMNGLMDGWYHEMMYISSQFLFYFSTPTQRGHLMTCFYNHVPTLVRHKEASDLIELAYNEYANAQQRSLLVQEFYGPQFALFKDESAQSLSDILSANSEQRTKLIGHMKQALMPLLDKYDLIYCPSYIDITIYYIGMY